MEQITNINQLMKDINNVVEYDWAKEQEDYDENGGDNHIFVTLVRLDNFVNGTTVTPEFYVQPEEKPE